MPLSAFLPQNGFIQTVRRFQLPAICAVLLCVLCLAEKGNEFWFGGRVGPYAFSGIYVRTLCLLGYFWFGAVVLIAEARRFSGRAHAVLAIGGFLILSAISLQIWQYGLLALSFGLNFAPVLIMLVMAAPYIGGGRDDDAQFWQFNFALWSGAAAAFLASLILWLGLCASIASIDYLFGAHAGSLFGRSWIVCATLIAPLYALFWVPRDFTARPGEYQRACAIMVNWILTPLICLYGLILYAYFGKILITATLPKGGLAAMVAGFGAVGAVFYLAAWPLRDGRNRLTALVHAHFFKALIVPLAMMSIAVYVRVAAYGITPERYDLIIDLVWFAGIAVAYGFGRTPPLKYIPLSLAALLFVTAFGPWSPVPLSLRDQLGRLDALMRQDHIDLQANRTATRDDLSFADRKRLSSMLRYIIIDQHAADRLPGLLHNVPDADTATRMMGFTFVGEYQQDDTGTSGGRPFHMGNGADGANQPVAIGGYDFLVNETIYVNAAKDGKWSASYPADPAVSRPPIVLNLAGGVLTVTIGNDAPLQFDIGAVANAELKKSPGFGPVAFGGSTLDQTGRSAAARLVISAISGVQRQNVVDITALNFRLLVKINPVAQP